MKFIKLAEGLGIRWNNSRSYYKTPNLRGTVQMFNGINSEFIYPETIDAYNLYATTPHVNSVIDRRGDLLANGIWKHKKLIKGEWVEVENSDYVNLLENPNPLQKGNDYLRQLNESKCVYGQLFEYIVRPYSSALPALLNILPADQMKIKHSGKWYAQTKLEDIIDYFEMQDTGQRFTTDEINYEWISNNKNPLQGESPLFALYMPIKNIRSAMQFRNVIMDKKGALGILSNNTQDAVGTVPLDADERLNLEKQFQDDYGIDSEKAQLLISNNNLTWQAMSFPTRDLMLFEEVEDDFGQILDAFGMKRDLFSSVKGATFENQSTALKQTYESTIIPEADEIAMNKTTVLGLNPKEEYLCLDYSHIPALQEDEKRKAEVNKLNAESIKILRENGFTPDQIESVTGIKIS